jgi:eukaryotic-like serine/threonine-protein kinase
VSTRPASPEELELDVQCYELRRGDTVLRLEKIPMELFILLVEHRDRLVGREEIIERLWGKDVFLDTEQGINTAIRKIRQVLHDDPERPRFVQTVFGRGYRFIAPILVTHNGQQSRTASEIGVVPRETDPEGRHPSTKKILVYPRHWITIAALAVFAATCVGGAYILFHRAPVLTEKDTIVLADFTNTTGDSVFDGTLRQGLETQLEQSPFLSVISENRVQQTLRLMSKPADTRLTPEMARDLCQRVGSKAYIESSIANLGKDYVIGLKAVGCATGDSLAQEQVQVLGKEKVLDALSQAAVKLREKLGESLSSVQNFDTPLAQATTPSLEALQALSSGRKTLDNGDYTASVLSFQRAIAFDPNFALAYSGLSANYVNLGENSLAVENAKKAFELRERVTEREKFAIESAYYITATGDLEKARQTLELWAQAYPRDSGSHFNLGNLYNSLGLQRRALWRPAKPCASNPE